MERRPLVLACEDEERIVELLRALTEPLGVDLIAARDGASALAHLAARKPALMTLDLVLPNLDGFGVLERIRQRRELDDMPIVVISAIADANTVKRAYALGVVDFVAKPFNVDLLDAKLKVFLRMQRLADEVRTRQEFLENVVDHLSSGLIVIDEQGVIVKVNAAAAAVLSRVAETLIGRTVAEALPGAEPLFLVSGDSAQRRVTIETENGARNLGFTNAAVDVGGGRGALAVFRELSEVEAARREQEDRARREELAGSARSFAHEVRNPLAAIGAAAQVVARDDCEKSQRIRLARAIESETTRVTDLVQEYVERRDVRRLLQSVDVTSLLNEVVEVNLLSSPARARISISSAATLPSVRADAARLKQVVLNLVLNAIKATDDGGTIALDARPEAGGVALQVTDTGCGIAASDLPRIFEESFSTRQGGGLGLPIARRIVEQHGGSIVVESSEGHGSSFTVWLPAA
ncbi:MAG: sensor histidine kinase [Myxococcales bacterium]|nr:sensor histidine kinase [Myxococcales bacterium]